MPTHLAPLVPHTSMDNSTFDELDSILDDLRTRYDETPQWEFCEGFIAAVVCCRRLIPTEEALAVLLDLDCESAPLAKASDQDTPAQEQAGFSSDAQRLRFFQLWHQRVKEVHTALDTPVEDLSDERSYTPELVDTRGDIAALPENERKDLDNRSIPDFAQVWALGFMFAVESWPDDWAAPKDKDAAKWFDASMQAITVLAEFDTDPPEVSPFGDDLPATASQKRVDAFAQALWAVYDLREIWQSIGPRVEQLRAVVTLGRNDPCHCGSGKKFKKCHGA